MGAGWCHRASPWSSVWQSLRFFGKQHLPGTESLAALCQKPLSFEAMPGRHVGRQVSVCGLLLQHTLVAVGISLLPDSALRRAAAVLPVLEPVGWRGGGKPKYLYQKMCTFF